LGYYCVDRQALWKEQQNELRHQQVWRQLGRYTVNGELPSDSVGEGAGVDNFEPKIAIPTVVDLREKKAVISLVLKLIPDVPVWYLEIMLSGMVLHFNGGTGTDWVPLGNAMSKVLQGVQENGANAGEKNLQMFVAGMHEALEKHVLAVRRAFTERNVQMRRKGAEADPERRMTKQKSCVVRWGMRREWRWR
jgi:hypothetical protein